MTHQDIPEGMVYAVHGHAYRLHRRFPMCDHHDIVQEMWLWWFSHPRIVKRYLEDEDEKAGQRKLSASLRNAGLAWCHKEKARVTGYEVEDLFFYSIGLLRDLLPVVYDREAWVRLGRGEASDMPKSVGLINEGNNAVACLTDVSIAIAQVPPDTRQLLELAFRDSNDDDDLASRFSCTPDAARMRVQRALRRLQDELGGERPDWAATR